MKLHSLTKMTIAEIFWGNIGKTRLSSTGPKDVCYTASATKFPCAKLLKLQGIWENDDCRLCKRLHPDVAPWPGSLSHIQARCPVLRKPRIAVHHGRWCELLTAISRNSLETHDDGEKKLYFPSAASEATHTRLTVRQIIVHLGLFSGIRRLEEEVATFYERQASS